MKLKINNPILAPYYFVGIVFTSFAIANTAYASVSISEFNSDDISATKKSDQKRNGETVVFTKSQQKLINKLIANKKTELASISGTADDLKTQDLENLKIDFENTNFADTDKFLSSQNRYKSPLIIADSGPPSDPTKWSSARPDGHAPIAVMGDHTHKKGEFMFSYRYMQMKMDGNRDGTDSISDNQVLQDFMVTPKNMTMEMHMLGAMYAPSDNLTLMAMVPYVFKDMEHVTRNGTNFTTNTEGFGDIKTSALYTFLDKDKQRAHLNFGISFPTGSIEERDDTPAGNDQILPYPMQIGSGTFDLLPGITYLGQSEDGSWGAQATGIVRLGRNSNDYQLGNEFQVTGWIARNWTSWLSSSLRLIGKTRGNIQGADSRLNPRMIPTADPDRRGGTELNIGLGINLYAPQGGLKGSRLAMELELPLYRDLDGPQLETDWQFTIGLQAAF